MAQIINISIDLAKVDKSQIKTIQLKNGNVGKFLNLSVFIKDEQDDYGNIASVSLSQSKEEREAAKPKVYVGNGKRTWANDPSTQSKPETTTTTDDDDLPF